VPLKHQQFGTIDLEHGGLLVFANDERAGMNLELAIDLQQALAQVAGGVGDTEVTTEALKSLCGLQTDLVADDGLADAVANGVAADVA
jgi:hypothetical protein